MTQTYEQAVEKVVKWWSEKSFRTLLNQNNGDNTASGDMAFLLMNMVSQQAQTTVTEAKIQRFEEELSRQLMAAKEMTGHRGLHVDYHPDASLSAAFDAAGIDSACAPCKSSTWIDQSNRAYGKYQYGGQQVEL